MAINFIIDIWPGTDLAKALERVKQEAAKSKHKLVISGSTTSGSVSGDIEGSYNVNGKQINFTITKAPAFATADMIKDELKRFF
ncbi:MAG: hypothetical protein M0D55_11120 [Elusimicrobiota bacterium]|nr:MAG: hypothetical protein M0D55_11120 [Elusimicrobiota bacterium]